MRVLLVLALCVLAVQCQNVRSRREAANYYSNNQEDFGEGYDYPRPTPQPRPVYYPEQRPIYIQPRPTYIQPRPIYIQPKPVYIPQQTYGPPPAPIFFPPANVPATTYGPPQVPQPSPQRFQDASANLQVENNYDVETIGSTSQSGQSEKFFFPFWNKFGVNNSQYPPNANYPGSNNIGWSSNPGNQKFPFFGFYKDATRTNNQEATSYDSNGDSGYNYPRPGGQDLPADAVRTPFNSNEV